MNADEKALSKFLAYMNWTQVEADRRANVGLGRTSGYLAGRAKKINVRYLDALARASGIAHTWSALGIKPGDEPYAPPVRVPGATPVQGGSMPVPAPTALAALPDVGSVPSTTTFGDPLADTGSVIQVPAILGGVRRFAASVKGGRCFPVLVHSDVTVWEADEEPPHGSVVLARREGDGEAGVIVSELRLDVYGEPRLHPLGDEKDEVRPQDSWKVFARLVGVVRDFEGAQIVVYSEGRAIRAAVLKGLARR